MERQPGLLRGIGRWSLVALLLNTIVGSGIFGLPSLVSDRVGAAAPLAYLAAAAGMGVVVACFAEVASRFREAGGPYLYARAALGRFAGIEIAWLTWLSRLSAGASHCNLFVIYFGEFWPRARDFVPRLVIITLVLAVLAAVNYRGVKAGTHLSDFFTVAKLLPLLVFLGVGLWFVRPARLAVHSAAGVGAWLEAVLLLVYAFGGFEASVVPMSEAKDPQRDAPFALFTALGVTALLFTLIQIVVTGVLAAPERVDRPLAAAAREFLGFPGAVLMTLGALISVYGALSAIALSTPRLTFALAQREDFPRFFAAVHPRFRSPHVSILAFVLLVWVLAVAGSFRSNVTLSAVARVFTYASTCIALVVLRKQRPGEEAFRLPAGPVFATLGVAFSLVLIGRMGRAELLVLVATMAIALVNWLWARRHGKQ